MISEQMKTTIERLPLDLREAIRQVAAAELRYELPEGTTECLLLPVNDALADAARRYREAVAGGHGMYIDRAVRELQAAALRAPREDER